MLVVTREEVRGNFFPGSVMSLLFSEHALWVFFPMILMMNSKGSTLPDAVPYCHMTVSLTVD